jgi:hypothetical protein
MKYSNSIRAFPKHLLALTVFAGTLTACGLLFAQTATGNGPSPTPPAEALDACKTLARAQACNFTSHRGTVQGTCWAPEGKPLGCKPKDAPMVGSPAPKQ